MIERWRETHLHPMYEVSDAGNVRRRLEYTSHCSLRPLKPYPGKSGYPKVQLGFRGPRIYVHRLVAIAYLGLPPCAVGWAVDHIDFDRTNNAAANLRWLPSAVNSVRWSGRENGRNIWSLLADEPAPEDHVPMTPEEIHDYDPARAGW